MEQDWSVEMALIGKRCAQRVRQANGAKAENYRKERHHDFRDFCVFHFSTLSKIYPPVAERLCLTGAHRN